MQAHDSDIYFDDIKMQMVPEGVARGRVGLARIGEKELARFWGRRWQHNKLVRVGLAHSNADSNTLTLSLTLTRWPRSPPNPDPSPNPIPNPKP